MKVFIICAKSFYAEVPAIKEKLEELEHEVLLPVLYFNPNAESEVDRSTDPEAFAKFRKKWFNQSNKIIGDADAVLALNFEKKGKANYIGSGMFVELYQAFMKNKKIYLWNYIPEGTLHDTIESFHPTIIKKHLKSIKADA